MIKEGLEIKRGGLPGPCELISVLIKISLGESMVTFGKSTGDMHINYTTDHF
jgi:hypothetical protein